MAAVTRAAGRSPHCCDPLFPTLCMRADSAGSAPWRRPPPRIPYNKLTSPIPRPAPTCVDGEPLRRHCLRPCIPRLVAGLQQVRGEQRMGGPWGKELLEPRVGVPEPGHVGVTVDEVHTLAVHALRHRDLAPHHALHVLAGPVGRRLLCMHVDVMWEARVTSHERKPEVVWSVCHGVAGQVERHGRGADPLSRVPRVVLMLNPAPLHSTLCPNSPSLTDPSCLKQTC